jgi:NAD+ synthase
VRALAAELGAPATLIHKVPTADLESLRPGIADEEVLGFSYDDNDDFLEGQPVRPDLADAIVDRHRRTAHKRQLPAGPPR